MAETGQSVVEAVISLVEANVSDINTERAARTPAGKWVYDEQDRADVVGYPRVRIANPTSNSEPHSLHSNEQRFKPRVEVQIRVKKNDKYLIAAATYRDIQAVDYLSKQITDVLRLTASRESLLSSDSVFYFELEAENTIYGEIITRQLIYKTVLVR
jgi:hypothetical protein